MNRQQSPYGPPAPKDDGVVTKEKRGIAKGPCLFYSSLEILKNLSFKKGS
jgi:hypothetical protein